MPLIPVRGLATKGILKDPSPYDLTPDAWSGGSNVRFDGTKAMRSPVFRSVMDSLPAAPAFCVGYRPSSGYDQVFVVTTAGRTLSYASSIVTDLTPSSGYTPVTPTSQVTSCFLGDVCYINNPATVPLYYGPASTAFAPMPLWDPTWTCAALRVYQDYIVALNVTKGANANPTMVKTSDNTLAGLTPDSWNADDPTKNTTETPLADLTSPIVDGAVLGSMFVIYSSNQIWQMIAVSTNEVFQFYRLFSEGGVISQNCVVEVDGLHYVFGTNDIYKHDGTSKASLLERRNRKWLYRYLNTKLSSRCFVLHMPLYGEILFAYVSSDPDAVYTAPTGCNKGAVYNLAGDTWSFVDLPNVTAMTLANLNSVLTWTTAGATSWVNMGGTWYDQVDGYDAHPVAVSGALPGFLTNSRILAYDFMNIGSLAFPYSPECNPPSYLERIGIDLDSEGAPISDYKIINRLFPQVLNYGNFVSSIQVGASMTSASDVVWQPPVSFDPVTDYKVDVRNGGRYLAYRFTTTAPGDYEVTGFDVDAESGGDR